MRRRLVVRPSSSGPLLSGPSLSGPSLSGPLRCRRILPAREKKKRPAVLQDVGRSRTQIMRSRALSGNGGKFLFALLLGRFAIFFFGFFRLFRGCFVLRMVRPSATSRTGKNEPHQKSEKNPAQPRMTVEEMEAVQVRAPAHQGENQYDERSKEHDA